MFRYQPRIPLLPVGDLDPPTFYRFQFTLELLRFLSLMAAFKPTLVSSFHPLYFFHSVTSLEPPPQRPGCSHLDYGASPPSSDPLLPWIRLSISLFLTSALLYPSAHLGTTKIVFAENQLSPSEISFSLLTLSPRCPLLRTTVQPFLLLTVRSLGFRSDPCYSFIDSHLCFLASLINSLTPYTKGTPSPLSVSTPFTPYYSGSISLAHCLLFNFLSRYFSLSLKVTLPLEVWYPFFRTSFLSSYFFFALPHGSLTLFVLLSSWFYPFAHHYLGPLG